MSDGGNSMWLWHLCWTRRKRTDLTREYWGFKASHEWVGLEYVLLKKASVTTMFIQS